VWQDLVLEEHDKLQVLTPGKLDLVKHSALEEHDKQGNWLNGFNISATQG
jgi:hypothetical protein